MILDEVKKGLVISKQLVQFSSSLSMIYICRSDWESNYLPLAYAVNTTKWNWINRSEQK